MEHVLRWHSGWGMMSELEMESDRLQTTKSGQRLLFFLVLLSPFLSLFLSLSQKQQHICMVVFFSDLPPWRLRHCLTVKLFERLPCIVASRCRVLPELSLSAREEMPLGDVVMLTRMHARARTVLLVGWSGPCYRSHSYKTFLFLSVGTRKVWNMFHAGFI